MSEINNGFRKNYKDNRFFSTISNFYAQVINGEDIRTEESKMIDTIRMAHEEWKNAEDFFENVTDPDLIDHAIYRVEAAKTRYTYLMRLAKEMGINNNYQ